MDSLKAPERMVGGKRAHAEKALDASGLAKVGERL